MVRRRGPGLIGVAARTAVVRARPARCTAVCNTASSRSTRRRTQAYDAAVRAAAVRAAGTRRCGRAAEPDYMAEIEQLAQLKNQGILSEEEFQAKKKQILGL